MALCTQNVVSINGLNRCFGEKQVLCDISLEVREGTFMSIVGASGAGKSTLINAIGLLDEGFTGTYRFLEKNIRDMTEREKAYNRNVHIGYVFQAYHLIPGISVKQNILLPASYIRKRVDKDHFDELVERLELKELLGKEAAVISGGEKQRVCIARALINNPSLIIADEPTGNLDYENTMKVLSILQEVTSEGRTVVMVTHNLELASRAHRKLVLENGKIVEEEKI